MIAHVFSNAGFLFSGTCLAREAEQEAQHNPPLLLLRSRLRGVIFDSCPARVDEDMALRGISAAARGVAAAKAAEAAAGREEESSSTSSTSRSPSSSSSSPHSILSPPLPPPPPAAAAAASSLRDSALKLALRAFLRSGPVERAMEAAWRAWEGPSPLSPHSPPPSPSPRRGGSGDGESGASSSSSPPPPSCPRIYAYSLTDALIPPESVEEVAAAAAARAEEKEKKVESSRGGSGGSSSPLPLPAVSLRVFDSPHCEHLRWHPREYLELMESFSRAVEEGEEDRDAEEEEEKE